MCQSSEVYFEHRMFYRLHCARVEFTSTMLNNPRYDTTYDTVNELHWKTGSQAASLIYEGRSINKLQNSVILFVFQI